MITILREGACAFQRSARPLAMEDLYIPHAEAQPAPAALDPLILALVAALRGIERDLKSVATADERDALPVAA